MAQEDLVSLDEETGHNTMDTVDFTVAHCRQSHTTVSPVRRSAEMTPVSGDDEEHASANERDACDNRSRSRNLKGRDLSGDEPHTGKQDQQEADLGECDTGLMGEREHRSDGMYFDRSN